MDTEPTLGRWDVAVSHTGLARRTFLEEHSPFLRLPPEIRHEIFSLLVSCTITGFYSHIAVTSKQLYNEFFHWLAGRQLIIEACALEEAVNDFRAPFLHVVVGGATRILIDVSYVPRCASHHLIDLMCGLWQKKCSLKTFELEELDERAAHERHMLSIPQESKELMWQWLLHPLSLVLADHKVRIRREKIHRRRDNAFRDPDWGTVKTIMRDEKSVELLRRAPLDGHELSPDELAWTPLVHALRQHHQAVMDVLLKNYKFDPVQTTHRGVTFLMEAAIVDNLEVFKMVRQMSDSSKQQDELDRQDNAGHSVLFHAIRKRSREVFQLAVQLGSDVNAQDNEGLTPLCFAMNCRLQRGEFAKKLLDCPSVDQAKVDRQGRTSLHIAAANGCLHPFRRLMRTQKGRLNEQDSYGRTPIVLAVEGAHKDLVEELVHEGARLNTCDRRGMTPLHHAACLKPGKAAEATVRLLLGALRHESASFINQQAGAADLTPLRQALSVGNTNTVLQFAHALTDRDPVLELANDLGKHDITSALLEKKMWFGTWRTNILNALLFEAAKKNDLRLVKAVLQHENVEKDVRDDTGRTPLSYAAEMRDEALVNELLFASARFDIGDKYGLTAKDYYEKHSRGRDARSSKRRKR